jgi:SAM-dependent methyltransferase
MPVTCDNITFALGDARDMKQFADQQFDVVYSNSVIEHVGDFSDIRQMAIEVRRVGKRYFLQTPNRYFPMEPHFLFPFFQFLPRAIQIALVQNFSLGWIEQRPDRSQAAQAVDGIRLLSYRELSSLFPDGKVAREKIFGLTKSLIAYKV